jgi:hypothetical protein
MTFNQKTAQAAKLLQPLLNLSTEQQSQLHTRGMLAEIIELLQAAKAEADQAHAAKRKQAAR